MLAAAIRVIARSAAIQLEEISARSAYQGGGPAAYLVDRKGKARATETPLSAEANPRPLKPIRRGDRLHGEPRAGAHLPNDQKSTNEAFSSKDDPSRQVELEVGASRSQRRSDGTGKEELDGAGRGGIRHEDGLSAQFDNLIDGEAPAESSKTAAARAATATTAESVPGFDASSRTVEPAPSLVNVAAVAAALPADARPQREPVDKVDEKKFSTITGEKETLGDVETALIREGGPTGSDLKADRSFSVPPADLSPAGKSETAPIQPSLELLTAVERSHDAIPPSEVSPVMNDADDTPVMLRASKVPSSRFGRLLHYGSLAASLGWGAASESIRRTAGGGSAGSVFMSDANVRRLVASLSRMRGAALKLGQFMSIQDNNMLPPEIERVLQQVQAHANYMPDWQMEKVMSSELGSDWTSLFSTFDRTPIASASIGQVHRATWAATGQDVAVKVQFPGIKDSITSDLSYLTPLLAGTAVLPRGLYLQNTIAVMKRELADECDYTLEAAAGQRFARELEGDAFFDVPKVVEGGCTERVLTTEWAKGRPLSRMKGMSQQTRDRIGTNILRLCLQELFHFRFMQTDPNWANFLYDPARDRVALIDFGASRAYTTAFMDGWWRLLDAALRGDREAMRRESQSIGYFTGEEEEVMVDAHLASMSLLAQPFAHRGGTYDFSHQTITSDVRQYIPVMLKHRRTPPPPETYSLNRKLSGAFLMCARLGARVDCAKLWDEWAGDYPQRRKLEGEEGAK